MRISTALLTVSVALLGQSALAKGLGELSDQNPEDAGDQDKQDKADNGDGDQEEGAKGEEEGGKGEEEGSKAETGLVRKSAASKAIADKLSLATSFGWVHASRSTGTWSSNGVADLTVAYKILPLGKSAGLAVTYRYVPIDVSGTNGDRSYRGVWEGHYVGARYNTWISQRTNLIGTGEVGLVRSHMDAVDGLPAESSVDQGGAAVALGGGVDYMISEKWAFAVGPRLYVAFGTVTSYQLTVGATFQF